MAASSSGARPERIPLPEYRHRLRELFGAGRFRIERDGRIRALCGCWLVWGRIGDPETVRKLFGRPL